MNTTVTDLAAEALFVSDLQPSERPCRDTVDRAVTAMILRHGSDGCAAGVATEFGDHPEAAVRRMAWARDAVDGGRDADGPGGAVGGPAGAPAARSASRGTRSRSTAA